MYIYIYVFNHIGSLKWRHNDIYIYTNIQLVILSLGMLTALRRSPLFPFPSHLAKFPFPSHLATFPSRGCARLELEKAATENRQM